MSSQKAHQPLFVLRQHSSAVMTCAMDVQRSFPSLLLSGDVDGVVKLWDLELRTPLISFHPVKKALFAAEAEEQKAAHAFPANNGVLKVGFLSFKNSDDKEGDEEKECHSLYFYTQCRNQHLYIWKTCLDSDNTGNENENEQFGSMDIGGFSVKLLHTINVPQHGFCTVPCVALSCSELQLVIPHDSDGVISLWNVTVVEKKGGSCEELQVTHSRSFSACGTGTKCGIIMCINYRDSAHIALAFESGHVTLNSVCGRRLAIIRAFAETALSCVWSGNTLLASSADGQLHCYTVMGETEMVVDGSESETNNAMLSLVVQWETTLPKGLGSMALQRHLVILGSWDHTLRLYDDGSGRVVSILTFHSGTVNEIALVDAPVAQYASFGYDVRRPRWCSTNNSGKKEEEGPVYLFASASGDYTIAIWRLDFSVLQAVNV